MKINKNWILFGIIIILLLIGTFIYLSYFNTPGLKVRVLRDNIVIDELSLSEDTKREYDNNGEVNTLVIKDNAADVISANCENQICVDSKTISNVGESIVCLPHKLIFEVVEN